MSTCRKLESVDRFYVAAEHARKGKKGAGSLEQYVRRKVAIWATYNERLERAFAAQAQK